MMVGERPRYIPLKPSFLTIPCRLVMITLPDISTDPERESLDQHATNFNKTKKNGKIAYTYHHHINKIYLLTFLCKLSFKLLAPIRIAPERERESVDQTCNKQTKKLHTKITYRHHTIRFTANIYFF